MVDDDDIDMRKKIKKWGKDARARAEGYQISP